MMQALEDGSLGTGAEGSWSAMVERLPIVTPVLLAPTAPAPAAAGVAETFVAGALGGPVAAIGWQAFAGAVDAPQFSPAGGANTLAIPGYVDPVAGAQLARAATVETLTVAPVLMAKTDQGQSDGAPLFSGNRGRLLLFALALLGCWLLSRSK
jgi:hypothetical protein